MILECKSCQKKFIVPDNAIPSTGRLVQCSSCGNKWTQYPVSKNIVTEKNYPTKKEVSKNPPLFLNVFIRQSIECLINISTCSIIEHLHQSHQSLFLDLQVL